MNPEHLAKFAPFRTEAIGRGIPADEVERWIATARPCAAITDNGDGPVVGWFGGPAMVPPGTDPEYPLVATIDLAAIPKETTDLPLSPDGHLLLFGFPDPDCSDGAVVYVPVGADVEEAPKNDLFYVNDGANEEYVRICQQYPEGPLHLVDGVSLPANAMESPSEPPWQQPLPGFPHSEELGDVWRDKGGDVSPRGPLKIGGSPRTRTSADRARPRPWRSSRWLRSRRAGGPASATPRPAPRTGCCWPSGHRPTWRNGSQGRRSTGRSSVTTWPRGASTAPSAPWTGTRETVLGGPELAGPPGIKERLVESPPQAPKSNAHCERVIGPRSATA